MIELIDIILNIYLRIFIGIILVMFVIISLYYSHIDKFRKLLRLKTYRKDWWCPRTDSNRGPIDYKLLDPKFFSFTC